MYITRRTRECYSKTNKQIQQIIVREQKNTGECCAETKTDSAKCHSRAKIIRQLAVGHAGVRTASNSPPKVGAQHLLKARAMDPDR